jgi:hypothetical protein
MRVVRFGDLQYYILTIYGLLSYIQESKVYDIIYPCVSIFSWELVNSGSGFLRSLWIY